MIWSCRWTVFAKGVLLSLYFEHSITLLYFVYSIARPEGQNLTPFSLAESASLSKIALTIPLSSLPDWFRLSFPWQHYLGEAALGEKTTIWAEIYSLGFVPIGAPYIVSEISKQ